MKMIDHVCAATVEYIDHMPKSKRKKYGQFFTSKETAVFMAGLFSIPEGRTSLSILDPGAGSGILSVALLERLESNAEIDFIELVCYENDVNIVDLLYSNLEWACRHTAKDVSFRIVTDNYILSQMLASVNISPEILVPTELLDGYVRIPVVNRDAINDMSLRRCVNISGQCVEISAPATEAEKAVLFAVWDLYASEDAKEQAKSKFMVRWDSFSSLRILHQWWDALSTAFTITHVGTVLAHTNARRCDNTIPELPLAT